MAKPHNRLGKGTGPRPHVWRSGPDPVLHRCFLAYVQCRNQARFRSEPWDLTWEQWARHWEGLWHRRGRTADSLCITRRDGRGAWTDSNVIIITRQQHGQRKSGISTLAGQGPNDRIIPWDWAAKP